MRLTVILSDWVVGILRREIEREVRRTRSSGVPIRALSEHAMTKTASGVQQQEDQRWLK